ncbi:hypothetical protein SRHO_G00096600 [Serrasalmus rhombeus]
MTDRRTDAAHPTYTDPPRRTLTREHTAEALLPLTAIVIYSRRTFAVVVIVFYQPAQIRAARSPCCRQTSASRLQTRCSLQASITEDMMYCLLPTTHTPITCSHTKCSKIKFEFI